MSIETIILLLIRESSVYITSPGLLEAIDLHLRLTDDTQVPNLHVDLFNEYELHSGPHFFIILPSKMVNPLAIMVNWQHFTTYQVLRL